MPFIGKSSHSCAGCSNQQYNEVDAHLIDYGDGHEGVRGGGNYGSGSSGGATFCPGASIPAFAPDLLLEPIHLDVTLHVDLEQQCMVVDQVLSVRLNVPTKSNTYFLSLDGIGFQHLHASRLTGASTGNSSPSPSPRGASMVAGSTSSSRATSLDFSSSSSHPPPSHAPTSSSRGLFSFLRSKNSNQKQGDDANNAAGSGNAQIPSHQAKTSSSGTTTPLTTSTPSLHHHSPSSSSLSSPSKSKSEGLKELGGVGIFGKSDAPLSPSSDSTSFYCTYDGRKITLSWVGTEAFSGGIIGTVEKVRLIYLVDKPITGLYFTKPPSEVELELLDQQQKPMVASTYATKDGKSKTSPASGNSSSTPPIGSSNTMMGRMSPFHASRPLLACTDHETERARYWLAMIDHPNVRPTAKWTFVVKAGLTAIANGELLPTLSETPVPHWPLSLFSPPIASPKAPSYPRALFVWNNPYPTASYLVAFAVGQLHYVEAVPPRHSSSNIMSTNNPSNTGPSSSTLSSSGHKRTRSTDGSFNSNGGGASGASLADSHSQGGAPSSLRVGGALESSTTSSVTAGKRSSSQRLGAISETPSSRHDHLSSSRASLDDFDLASSMASSAAGGVSSAASNSFNPFSAFLESSETPAGISIVSSLTSSQAMAAAATAAGTFSFAPPLNTTYSAFPSTATHNAATLHAMQVAVDMAHHKKPSKKREEAEWILKDIPMRYYTPRNVPLTTLQLMLHRTPEIMRWLQARVGLPFPYTLKYDTFSLALLTFLLTDLTFF